MNVGRFLNSFFEHVGVVFATILMFQWIVSLVLAPTIAWHFILKYW